MSRRTPLSTLVAGLAVAIALTASPSHAEMCTLDAVPAATLLLPYFEVDLDSQTGANTLFAINNATPEPTIAHVTFWTNLSQPTVNFDIFLTGFDMEIVNLREVFDDGFLPITADEQSDPLDTISPHGNNPQWDGSFTASPDCGNFFPFYINPLIVGSVADRVINGHTGKPISSLDGNCLGGDLGDNIARGYVTVDNARSCSIDFPSDPAYFSEVEPTAIDDNRLWGDYVLQNPDEGWEVRDALVHIEADPDFDQNSTSSGYTFYGRYSGGADHREPLSTAWGVRYANDIENDVRSDLIVWRDSTSSTNFSNIGFACDQKPPWFPMEETSVLCFNQQEDDVEVCGGEGETCFPYETQRVRVGDGHLALPFSAGWCQLNLNVDDNFAGDADFPVDGSPLAQSFVASVTNFMGVFSSGVRGVSLGSACEAPADFDAIFTDGFEAGSTSEWDSTSP